MRDRTARATTTRRPGRASTRQPQTTRAARPARKRSPRFYYGFGLVGIVLSAILAESTVANYNKAVSDYPGKLAAYHAAMAKYQAALDKYHAVHGHGMSLPKAPSAPVHPTLSILDFILPILYGALSIAYIYLGYRTTRAQQAGTVQQVKT